MNKIIVTLGPSTNTFKQLSLIKNRGVDFVRINMSHSTVSLLSSLLTIIVLSKQINP